MLERKQQQKWHNFWIFPFNVCKRLYNFKMIFLIVYLATFAKLTQLKDPILSLELQLSPSFTTETTFAIGNSQIRVSIDINYDTIDVCCKNKDTLINEIYYFMVNPFRQTEDYHCKNTTGDSRENDTAKFPSIGLLNIEFNEVRYPECKIGKLGLSKHSQFLKLMPVSEQFYVISRENEEDRKGQRWKLDVGGQVANNFQYLLPLDGPNWRAKAKTINFNGIVFQNQVIQLMSSSYEIIVPSKYYSVIEHQLINSFECLIKQNKLYCPCTSGISSSFPTIEININKTSFSLVPSGYLHEQDQICLSRLRQTQQEQWSVNIFLIQETDILLDFQSKRVAFASHHKSIEKNELINQPLQIILNCAVILIMCFFVAMVLIELIKYLIGFDDAENQSFQNYMLKHSQ